MQTRLSTVALGGREFAAWWLPNGTPDHVIATAQADGWLIVLGKPFGWHLVKAPKSHEDERSA